MTQPNSVFCELEGCRNTAFFRFNGVALCLPCIDRMAAMNSDNEQILKTAIAVAEPIQECPWICGICGAQWDSFHIRNGVCNDCRSAQPYLWIDERGAMNRLQYCERCDVYVGLVPDGRIVVVPGGVLREVIADCERNGSPIPDELVYDPVEWLQDAISESDEFAWIEDGVRGSWWYQWRGSEHHSAHREWLLHFE